ncbi:MAG: 6-phosphofructokinase [Clostridia bacterium]|nr:6-phosphofructokinase [Clostridia bacterium]
MKTIGVLTSGGDAPGMNSAVYSVVKSAAANGIKVYGIKYSYWGLTNDIDNCLVDFDLNNISDILNKGGSYLRSMRFKEFYKEDYMQQAIANCRKVGIEGLVVIGGDGSFRGARDLTVRGLPCIGIPGTIDNDIPSSDFTLGYDTCLNTIMNLCNSLEDTISSNDRCMVVEVMGNKCSDLPLNGGIACGANVIVVPEMMESINNDAAGYVVKKLSEIRDLREKAAAAKGSKDIRKHYLVLVAEKMDGVNVADIAKAVQDKLGIESRSIVLGHLQRGGSPSAFDVITGCQMGNKAVKLLMEGIGNRVVVKKGIDIVDYDILEALEMKSSLDMDLFNISVELGA